MFSSVFSEFAQSRFDSTCQPSQLNENEVKDNNRVSELNIQDVHQSINFDRNDDDVPTEIRCFDPKVTLVVTDANAHAENDDVDHKKSVQQNEEDSDDDSNVVNVEANTNETTETIVVINSRDDDKSGSEEKNAMTSTSCAPPLHSSVNKQEEEKSEEKSEEKREVENKQETVENNNCSLSNCSSSISCTKVDTVHHNLPFEGDDIILKNKETYLYKNRDENNSLWIYCDKGSSDEQNTKHPVPDETICVLCVFSVDTEDVDAMTRVKKHGNLLQKYSHKCEKHKLSQ